MSESFNIALVCILHLNKGTSQKACYRTMGSLAFPAAARTVWLVSGDPTMPGSNRRLFIAAKHNILKQPTTLAFEVRDNVVVFDEQPVNITADDVFAKKSERQEGELQLAMEFLEEIFQSASSIAAKEVFELAEQQDYKIVTIRRAKKELGITSYQKYDEEGKRLWYWRLNNVEEEKQKLLGFFRLYACLSLRASGVYLLC